MGMANDDDSVLIEKGRKAGEPWIITVNCPGKTGLGCDICRNILDFGLYITKADVSTDGKWCYIVLWVVPDSSIRTIRWENLKERLLSLCPPCSLSHYYSPPAPRKSSPVYLLKFCCLDRRGLLHDVTQVLSELELSIERVKVMTTPDGSVLDLFFVTDNLELLHTKKRQEETCDQLRSILGEACISCELQLADSPYEPRQRTSSLSPAVAEELFASEYSKKQCYMQALSPEMTQLKKAVVNVDNSLSPNHTVLQIHCVDHKGLLYDIMRTLKDNDIQILYGRVSAVSKGHRDIDLFIQQDDKKIMDPEKEYRLCSCLKMEMLHPLRVIIAHRGPDTELLVANPVELSGRGRPQVFYDVTLALKKLGICVFSAEIGRYTASDREWEVYRFLLDENHEYQLLTPVAWDQIVDKVRRMLMGW